MTLGADGLGVVASMVEQGQCHVVQHYFENPGNG